MVVGSRVCFLSRCRWRGGAGKEIATGHVYTYWVSVLHVLNDAACMLSTITILMTSWGFLRAVHERLCTYDSSNATQIELMSYQRLEERLV